MTYRITFISLIFVLVVHLSMAPVCAAQEVKVGIGFAIPPYVIKETHGGVEVDIIREAFKAQGHEATFVYLPNLRLPLAFSLGEVDCIATNAAYDLAVDTKGKVFASNITVVFQNYAVSLRDRNLNIKRIMDLADKEVLGFNNAAKYLGPDFTAMVANNANYWELADQSLQVRLLYSQRADVVVSDKRIFLWWREKLAQSKVSLSVDLDQPLEFSPIFQPAPRHVAFSDSALRDAFDAGLAAIKESGVTQSIATQYLAEEYYD